MPQLDIATFPSQLFWLAITFTALYVLMSRIALPKMVEILDARQKHIEEDLERAASLNAEADSALAAYERQIAKARDDVKALLADTTLDLQKDAEARHKALGEEIFRETAEAEARIKAARDAALAEIDGAATDVARAAVERLTGLQIDAGAAGDAVARAAAERA